MESVNTYHSELSYNYICVGTFQGDPVRGEGIHVCLAPLEPMDSDKWPFKQLEGILHKTGLAFKIKENGEVWILVPFYQKFGYLLGAVSRAYSFKGAKF